MNAANGGKNAVNGAKLSAKKCSYSRELLVGEGGKLFRYRCIYPCADAIPDEWGIKYDQW